MRYISKEMRHVYKSKLSGSNTPSSQLFRCQLHHNQLASHLWRCHTLSCCRRFRRRLMSSGACRRRSNSN